MAREPNTVPVQLDRVLADIAGARHYNKWLFDRARSKLGGRVLDAGAGVGTFTALARDAGATVTALEPEPDLARRLRERFADDDGVDLVEAALEEAHGLERFDSILCFNVLEHVDDDDAGLRRLRAMLRPGGVLFLLVPAHPRLHGGYDRAVGHARRYGRSELRLRLTRAGFEIEELRHVNPVGALGWFLRVRLWRGSHWPSSAFHTFDRLVPVLRPLDRLRLPFGLSLWAVARNRPSDGSGRAR